MRRRAPSRRGLAIGATALLLLAAGCSRSHESPKVATVGGTATASATVDPELAGLTEKEKALKFAQCMRDHGVPMEDPTFTDGGGIGINIGGDGKGGDTLDKSKVDAAMQACKKYSPMEGNGGKLDPKAAENMRKMSQCMRDNGVENFPDPTDGGLAIDGSIANDPDFEAAQTKCDKLYGPPGGGKKTNIDGGNS